MAQEEGVTEGNTSSSPVSTNQVPQAAPSRGPECPICLDIIKDQVSVSWCRHTFCFSCILHWSRIRAVCPSCHEPFQYLFRKVGDSNYEVYFIKHYSTSARHNRGRRSRRHSAERRRHRSSGRRQHSSSSRERSTGRARARERDRSRSLRRHRSGHSRDQQARGYDPSSSRRRQQTGAQDTASDTSSDEHQASRPERDVPVRSARSERRHWGRQVDSREPPATRNRSRRTSHSPDRHRDR